MFVWQVENEESDLSAFEELGRLGEVMDFFPEGNIVATGKQRKSTTDSRSKQHSQETRIQYATRGKKRSYCEPEVPDDDHYICELKRS